MIGCQTGIIFITTSSKNGSGHSAGSSYSYRRYTHPQTHYSSTVHSAVLSTPQESRVNSDHQWESKPCIAHLSWSSKVFNIWFKISWRSSHGFLCRNPWRAQPKVKSFEMQIPLKIQHQKGFRVKTGNSRLGAAHPDSMWTTRHFYMTLNLPKSIKYSGNTAVSKAHGHSIWGEKSNIVALERRWFLYQRLI